MPRTLDPELRLALAERVRYCHEMGIYDFYRRESAGVETLSSTSQRELREEMTAGKSAVAATGVLDALVTIASNSERGVADPVAALRLIREDLGECTRCKLHQGRNLIVFGVGDPHAEL